MEQQTVKQSFYELLNSETPVLVDFHADWCGPCKAMSPLILEIARERRGQIKVIKVDIDQSQAAAQQFNVTAVPTFILFKSGKQLWRHSGMIDKPSLIRVIESSVNQD